MLTIEIKNIKANLNFGVIFKLKSEIKPINTTAAIIKKKEILKVNSWIFSISDKRISNKISTPPLNNKFFIFLLCW